MPVPVPVQVPVRYGSYSVQVQVPRTRRRARRRRPRDRSARRARSAHGRGSSMGRDGDTLDPIPDPINQGGTRPKPIKRREGTNKRERRPLTHAQTAALGAPIRSCTLHPRRAMANERGRKYLIRPRQRCHRSSTFARGARSSASALAAMALRLPPSALLATVGRRHENPDQCAHFPSSFRPGT